MGDVEPISGRLRRHLASPGQIPVDKETLLSVLSLIEEFSGDLVAIRHDLRAHPEIGFEEERISAIVAQKLEDWGVEVHRGLGGTGVITGKRPGERRIGLRADI